MANKIKLGQRPKSFKRAVNFPMLDGTEGSMECVFKYRTRTEFGALIDEIFTSAGEAPPKDDKFSMVAILEKSRDKNADYLLQIMDGWNLDEEMTRDSLQQLADEIPAAVNAIMVAYREAVSEGRMGN